MDHECVDGHRSPPHTVTVLPALVIWMMGERTMNEWMGAATEGIPPILGVIRVRYPKVWYRMCNPL